MHGKVLRIYYVTADRLSVMQLARDVIEAEALDSLGEMTAPGWPARVRLPA
jgi:hypothetical protein